MILPVHIIVPDTNVLRAEPSGDIVSPKFCDRLKLLRKAHQVKLYVPSIVRSEIVFQKLRVAGDELAKGKNSLSTVARMSGLKFPVHISAKKLREAIFMRFDEWLASVDGKLVETPISEIDWLRTIELSVWREPPFDPPETKKEKGFRDSLVLETACSIIRQHENAKVWLLTGDERLKIAFSAREPQSSVCADIEALEGHLALIKTQVSEQYAQQLVNAANEMWEINRKGNLYDSLAVEEAVKTEYAATLRTPSILSKSSFPVGRPFPLSILQQPRDDLSPVGQPVVHVMEVRSTNVTARLFIWCTTIKYMQLYQPVGASLLLMAGGPKELTLVFDVHWTSKVTRQPTIVEPKLESIVKKSQSLEMPRALLEYLANVMGTQKEVPGEAEPESE